jgi:hypothetical protein
MKIHFFVFLVVVSTITTGCSSTPSKRIIGAIEIVKVENLQYLARIDTGADITSINAYDILVENEVSNATDNIGKQLRFTTANEKGDSRFVTAPIVKINTVRSAFGAESRYVVLLTISWGECAKTVEVNLRDRSKMQFALLIGRNWLKNDFIVDVSDKEKIQEQSDYFKNLLPKILTP